MIDHPAFEHKWLWELLSATEYKSSLNPGDTIDDEKMAETMESFDIEDESSEENTIGPEEKKEEEPAFNLDDILNGVPDVPETEIIADWKEHFKNFDFKRRIASAHQHITNVKSQHIITSKTYHENPNENINIEDLNTEQNITTEFNRAHAIATILSDIEHEPHRILISTYKAETAKEISILTDAIMWILNYHFHINAIADIELCSDETLKQMLFCLPLIFDEMKDPNIIPSILQSYDTE